MKDILIENLDTLSYGVLDPRTTNFLSAYDDMRSDLESELDNDTIELLAVIVHLGDSGEEEVSMEELKAAPFKKTRTPEEVEQGVRALVEEGLVEISRQTRDEKTCAMLTLSGMLKSES
ncbi:MAG: BREX-1 system adenine-specific DNA-methyltransferase PglX [Bacteroidia bacterium]|nr:BREX-1 system adenine-specific DNA-methyltransferase PglX [Bacteroidia bacterium]